jgi:4a-hydroxytetrahydrobiopterin dehydratase
MPALSESEVTRLLAGLPGWHFESGEITRQFRFRDFVEAFGFIAQVATLQEQMNHHATITNTWANVRIALSTHDARGVTERDFELARKISERGPHAQRES